MKKIFLIFSCILFGVSLHAHDYPDKIYLKNGNFIRGHITEIVSGKSITIRSRDGKLYKYSMNEVDRLDDSLSQKNDNKKYISEETNYPQLTYPLEKGFRGFVDLGYSLTTGSYENVKSSDTNRIEGTLSLGYQFNRRFFLGVGFGLNYFNSISEMSYPVYLYGRYDFKDLTKTNFFVAYKQGYVLGHEDLSGLYSSPSIGIRFAQRSGAGLNLSLGYTAYWVNGYVNDTNDNTKTAKVNLGALTLNVGFDF